MNPPASSQHSSIPKHSSPNDLTNFITKHIGHDFPISRGGFASVYKCIYKDKRGGKPVEIVVAVKVLHTQAQSNTIEVEEVLWREIGIWKRMRHECIVPLLGTTTDFSADHSVSFVSSWMPNGTLNTYLKTKKDKISLREKYDLLCDVADGLHYLHSESVVHGDLTSTNVLINENKRACLTDFGLSSMIKIGERFEYLRPNKKQAGAWRWSAPELILGLSVSRVSVNEETTQERYVPSPSSDIYSYGWIIHEVLSGKTPWQSYLGILPQPILEGKTPPRPHSKDMQDEDWIFTLQCWLSLPSLRPFASQALKFARTRRLLIPIDQAKSHETSKCASLYTAYLDGANVYNLSSLVHLHPQAVFSDPAICWKSIDNLVDALIGLFTTKQDHWPHGLNDAIQLYHVSFALLTPNSGCTTSSLRKISSAIASIGAEQRVVEASMDTIERMMGPLGNDNLSHFTGFSYLSLAGIAQHMLKPDPHFFSRVKDWYRKSFGSASDNILCRLQIALACARITESIGPADFSLEAYEMSLELLQQHVSAIQVGAWAESVENLSTSLAVNAATAALHLGKVNKAVELLEWGRELFRTYNVRSHADERGEEQISEKPILEADCMPCQRPSFSDLLTATQDGPVIILIASRRSCDAIIVSKAHLQPLHIPLTINLRSLVDLSNTFQACISPAPEGSDSVEEDLRNVLRCLWVDVVAPVIHHLILENVPCNSRIWWCPTSIFSTLPVHAAGDYTPEGKQLSRYYVSSYTFSITSLLRARTYTDHPKSFSQFAAIYQAKPLQNDEQKKVEYPVIESAEVEPDILICNLPASLFLTRFANATKDDAKEAFEGHGWFHLLAYATENVYQPLNFSLLMRDGSLSIPDILRANPRPKEFAFLSTRPVGSRFNWMQNEIVQFTAGLQIAGFKSVVGTMGNVCDSNVIDKFYSDFFRTVTPDCTRAARALHNALEEMANSKAGLSLGQRIAFVHFGL